MSFLFENVRFTVAACSRWLTVKGRNMELSFNVDPGPPRRELVASLRRVLRDPNYFAQIGDDGYDQETLKEYKENCAFQNDEGEICINVREMVSSMSTIMSKEVYEHMIVTLEKALDKFEKDDEESNNKREKEG